MKRVLPRILTCKTPSSFCSALFYQTNKDPGDIPSNWKSCLQNLRMGIRWLVKEFLQTAGFLLKYNIRIRKEPLAQRRSFQADLSFRLSFRVDIVNQVEHCGSWSLITTTKFEKELLHLWDTTRFVVCNCSHVLSNRWRRTGCRSPILIEFPRQWLRSNLAQSGYTTRKGEHLPWVRKLCTSISSYPLARISARFWNLVKIVGFFLTSISSSLENSWKIHSNFALKFVGKTVMLLMSGTALAKRFLSQPRCF